MASTHRGPSNGIKFDQIQVKLSQVSLKMWQIAFDTASVLECLYSKVHTNVQMYKADGMSENLNLYREKASFYDFFVFGFEFERG